LAVRCSRETDAEPERERGRAREGVCVVFIRETGAETERERAAVLRGLL
jgi:hypothetical protein